MHEYRHFADAEELARTAADHLAARIREYTEHNGVCRVALPGGRTPARCLALLAQASLPWERVHWYVGDERCYPTGHEERNDVMLESQLWSRIDAPAENRHPIAAELGPEAAAMHYSDEIRAAGLLDLVLLGMGEDGHTASLVPGNARRSRSARHRNRRPNVFRSDSIRCARQANASCWSPDRTSVTPCGVSGPGNACRSPWSDRCSGSWMPRLPDSC